MKLALSLAFGLVAAPALAAPVGLGAPPPSLAETQRRDAAQAEAETRARLARLQAGRVEQPGAAQLAGSRDRRVVEDRSASPDTPDQDRRAGEVDAWLAKGRKR